MPRPPITKKPIPKLLLPWRNEVDGIWGFLDELGGLTAANGRKWVKAQREYSHKRLADLLDNAPKGAKIPSYLRAWRRHVEL